MHTILYIRRASYVWGLIIKGCITKHLLTEKFPALNILCIDGCDVFLVIFASQPYNTSKSKNDAQWLAVGPSFLQPLLIALDRMPLNLVK